MALPRKGRGRRSYRRKNPQVSPREKTDDVHGRIVDRAPSSPREEGKNQESTKKNGRGDRKGRRKEGAARQLVLKNMDGELSAPVRAMGGEGQERS